MVKIYSSACVSFHSRENKPKNGGICVANHTTPIDVIILANDGRYSLVESLLCVSVLLMWKVAPLCVNLNFFTSHTGPWGRPGARRVAGNGPAGHAQVLASHLVWEIRSQRQTPCGQKVTENLNGCVHHSTVDAPPNVRSEYISHTFFACDVSTFWTHQVCTCIQTLDNGIFAFEGI